MQDQHTAVDPRAVGALPDASPEVADLWDRATACAAGDLPAMGLHAGDRPCADVEVLAGVFAAVEYEVARRMHAATTSGALPLIGPGAVLTARDWSAPHARRLARTGALAAEHPTIGAAWAAGTITSEHVDAVARHTAPLTPQELAAVIHELTTHWGHWSPAAITRFVTAAARMLHPPTDPEPGQADAHTTRNLSFSQYGDSVLLSAALPRLEGETVIAAIDAWAEKLRTTADHTPTGARRADALVELVNTAASTGVLPTRGGLPVALTVTLEHTPAGDPIWTTNHGHHLTPAEQRFTACDPTITPVLVGRPEDPDCPQARRGTRATARPATGDHDRCPTTPTPAVRIAALAELLLRWAAVPPGRRTEQSHRDNRPTPRPSSPRRRLHHPRLPDTSRNLPNPPPHRMGRRRPFRPAQPRAPVLEPPSPGRPGHVVHRAGSSRY